MEKIFIGIIFLISLTSFLLTTQYVFSKEVFTLSLSKDKYVVGENIVINLEINNVYDNNLNATWLFWVEPPLEKYAGAPEGSDLIEPGGYRNETYTLKSDIPGYHTVIARLFDEKGILLFERSKQFLVTNQEETSIIGTNLIYLTITIVIILIALFLMIYERKKMKRHSIRRKK